MIGSAPRIESEAPSQLQIGERGPDFEHLLGVDGQRHSMSDFTNHPVLVVIFSSNRCPTVHAYEERLRALQNEYGPRGVLLVAINANDEHLYPEESYEAMVAFADASRYNFPYLQDQRQETARAYGATRTFEIFVLDEDRRLRYHGRFDDARLPDRVTSHDLRNALDALLEGRRVPVPVTKAFGCSLDLV